LLFEQHWQKLQPLLGKQDAKTFLSEVVVIGKNFR
jgi:hypothetical protein